MKFKPDCFKILSTKPYQNLSRKLYLQVLQPLLFIVPFDFTSTKLFFYIFFQQIRERTPFNNNHYHPRTLQAIVESLTFNVQINLLVTNSAIFPSKSTKLQLPIYQNTVFNSTELKVKNFF